VREDSPVADTVPLADGDAAAAPATYGRFIALEMLGRGGMGVVMRAHDPELGRDVALKVLLPGLGTARLQTEAQAMARLSHPNVVAVYEIGLVGTDRFIAMELVEGSTLRGWLGAKARPWREIVAAFVACGRGLAAAHAAGLVHRDFKPENVLVGADDRPRVADFGLVGDGAPGAMVGTPGYMAPEQWLGGDVDARADQFAFCVGLWEALYGQRPFPGETAEAVRDAVLGGSPRGPSASPAPRALAAILRRGLARDRVQRWPSMAAIVTAIERAARGRRGLAIGLGAGAAVVVAATVAFVVGTRSRGEACGPPTSQLAGVWDKATRAELAGAIRASGAADGALEDRLVAALDGYASAWSSGMVAACKAGPAQGANGGRAVCLERGRGALAALTHALVTADRATLARADDAIARLPDLTACDDLERLAATTPLPQDPALRARLAELDRRLDAIGALQLRAELTDARAGAAAAVAEARSLGHAPTLAHALQLQGDVEADAGNAAAAEAAYRAAASAAADGRDDLAAAEAWASVLFTASDRLDDLEGAAALVPVVDAAVRRAGDPPSLRFKYLNAAGVLADVHDDFATSYARFDEAAKVAPNPRHHAQALCNLALVVWRRDGAIAAVEPARVALAATTEAMGPDHLETAGALRNAAQILNAAGQWAEAKTLAERALAIQERANGADSSPVGGLHEVLGNITSNLGDLVAARAHFERSIAIKEATHAGDAELGISFAALGAMLQYSGQGTDAIPYYERSLALLATSVGTEKFEYLMISANLADTYQDLGRCEDAQPIIERVRPALAKMPAYYPILLLTIARCARERGAAAALAPLEEASRLCAENGCDPSAIATFQWELGTALVETRRDRARGLELVRAGRAGVAAISPDDPLVATIDAWLAKHGR
jgi:tetratricopeptide (TPR) repeat protein